jgi:hypothetical protein
LTQIGEGIAARFGFGGPFEPGSLEMTVVERQSREPVAGVEATLHGSSGGRATTGADGVARFQELDPGLYMATVLQPEFELEYSVTPVYVGPGRTSTASLPVRRILMTVVLKRIHIGDQLKPDAIAGHWWTEIDQEESYGWYPAKRPDPLWKGITGVPGRLNGSIGEGTPTTDARHGQKAGEMFHPRIVNGSSAATVKECIRTFAKGYSGTWSYPGGQNCHSFQVGMMTHCGMIKSGRQAQK